MPDPHKILDVDKTISDDANPTLVWEAVVNAAVSARVSDIHCLAQKEGYELAFRLDGELLRQGMIDFTLGRRVISHIKSVSGMDLGEHRRPTEGRLKETIAGKAIDLRISCVPSIHGLDMVVRLFDHTVSLLQIEELGMLDEQIDHIVDMVERPNGLILVSGASGSGKTTTLYALLRAIRGKGRKIMTIEDPVEYDLEQVNQTQVNARIDVTFASMLMAILRQDPDVIMVGEIRDEETARTAVRAANTGHLVLATIHATTAARAVESMLGLGVQPYFFNVALRCVVAQILVKRICPECRTELPETGDMIVSDKLKRYLPEETTPALAQGTGCSNCFGTGYHGRIGLFEVMIPDQRIRQLIMAQAPASQIEEALETHLTIEQVGKLRAMMGITTMEELVDAIPSL